MTIACLGSRCAYKKCRLDLKEDEGVGLVYQGEVVWLHSRCARKVKQRQQKREKARRLRGAKTSAKRRQARGSRRVGAVS